MSWLKRRPWKTRKPGGAALLKKLLIGAGVAVAVVVAVYYVGVNALLASSWGPSLINQKPELVRISYSRAWSLVPLRVEVRDFRLSMQDRLVQISITADRVHGNLHPWTLVEQRFIATQVEGDGVTMRIRPRLSKGDPLEAHLDELPPIEGYDSPIRDQSENEVDAKDIRFLSLLFTDLTVHHLREVWVDRVRYTGDAEVTGGMLYEPFRRLRLDDVHFSDANSKLVAVEPNTVAIERIEGRVTLGEVNLSALDFKKLSGLDAELKLTADADPRFLNSYLTNASGLSTLSASGQVGRLEVAMKIERGVVLDGAKLSYQTPRAAVRLPLVEVSGAANVQGKAAKGRLDLDVAISNAALRQRDGKHLVDVKRFTLGAASDADLTHAPDVDAVLALTGGRVKTLRSFNQFIPPGAGVHLGEGSGLVEGTLWLEAKPARAHGKLDLTSEAVTLKNRSATLDGKLAVHGEIKALNLTTGALNLSGSTVALEDATLQAQGRTWPHFWLRAVAEPCALTPGGKVLWSSTINVGSSNLQPLLALVSANLPLPKALSLVTNSPNVRVQATIEVREDGVELPRLVLTSQSVRAEGAVSLRERDTYSKVLEPWGGVLVHAGALNAGVQLDGPKVTLVLFDLDRWADSRKLRPPAAPAP